MCIYLYDISEINYIVIVRLHNLIMKNYNVQVNLEHCMLRNWKLSSTVNWCKTFDIDDLANTDSTYPICLSLDNEQNQFVYLHVTLKIKIFLTL